MALLILALDASGQTARTEVSALKSLSLAQLMDIEVTSVSRRTERLSETPSAVQVINGEDIQRAGITRLPAALRLLSNLQVAQIDSRQWAITARGFNNSITNKMLVLLDGRVLYTPLFAGVFWDAQDTFLSDIDRIEAISGPGATQWGSNAVNGVINITTKPARATQGGLFRAGIGSEMQHLLEARYGGTAGQRGFYRVYVKTFDRDDSHRPGGAAAHDAWRRAQGGFRFDWEASATDVLTVQGDIYDSHMAQPERNHLRAAGGNLIGRWTRTLSPDAELSAHLYYDYTFRRIPGSITESLNIYEFDFHHRTRLRHRHAFSWGATLRRMDDDLRNPDALAFLPAHVSRSWEGFFLQNETASAQNRVRTTLGAKLERNPYTGWELQPSARVGWLPRERHFLWAAVSRALRTPSRIDREFFVPATPPFAIAGGPAFHSEELIAYETGYRTHLREELAVSISTFFHDYDDLRSLEPMAAGGNTIANGLKGHSYGAELLIDYRVTPTWRVRAGYTEQRVSSAPKAGSADRTSARSQALDPNRQVVLHSQLDLMQNVSLDVVARHVAPIGNQQVPGYAEVDVRVGWRPIPALELSVVGNNLVQPHHAEFGPPATRREIDRSVTGLIRWRF